MQMIMNFYDEAQRALEQGASIDKLVDMPVRERIGRFKYTPEDKVEEEYARVQEEITRELGGMIRKEDL